jgi:hypothetical protein
MYLQSLIDCLLAAEIEGSKAFEEMSESCVSGVNAFEVALEGVDAEKLELILGEYKEAATKVSSHLDSFLENWRPCLDLEMAKVGELLYRRPAEWIEPSTLPTPVKNSAFDDISRDNVGTAYETLLNNYESVDDEHMWVCVLIQLIGMCKNAGWDPKILWMCFASLPL